MRKMVKRMSFQVLRRRLERRSRLASSSLKSRTSMKYMGKNQKNMMQNTIPMGMSVYARNLV